ncbi:hypothetical protein M8Z33_25990 [Streptomyces sp. ZAF1911]|uniref:hypothetical protein n=1 Tax=Streptomyces sp. ZAF1911 TaxID=2944129 RepID=UPI00237AAEF4|nr:hypothetical protein [Streptomyces sp. ZAF1911]MDD9380046.1 hypothetical protein [Streptomyces sp. ZAF1911]
MTPVRWGALSAAVVVAVGGAVWVQSAEQQAAAGTASVPSVALRDGHLVYTPGSRGDRIPDFSSVGYRAGAALPQARQAVALEPAAKGDDTSRIQNAIDTVAQQKAAADGTRGAVVLRPGRFRLQGTLHLAGGVVLRGSGTGTGGTLLIAAGVPRPLITIGTEGQYKPQGRKADVTSTYVPVGARSFDVDDAKGFAVGDQVVVQRPTTAAWIRAIGMDKIPGGEGWKPDDGILAARTVTAVKGRTVTLDAPLTTAVDKQYGGATLWHYTQPGRVTDAGVENLAADATAFTKDPGYGKPEGGKNNESGAFDSRLLSFGASRDVWAKDLRLTRFGTAIWVEDNAGRVTVARAAALDMAVPDGLAPPAAFMIDGQQVLVHDTEVTGDNIHAWTTFAFTAGPNVFTRGTARAATTNGRIDAGPHMKWGSGTLYDRLSIEGAQGAFIAGNAWNGGTGHGWQGANNVFWNTTSALHTLQQPPTAFTWAYGVTGKSVPGTHDKDLPAEPAAATAVSPGKPVRPDSLYTQQVSERP